MALPATYEQLGRFQILTEVGQGAMGVVYKAVDPLLERTVALKTINLALSKEELEDFEQRFYREAKSAGRLNHPNIVTIYDVGKTDNVAFMAMEFLEGRSLRDVLDSGVVLSLERIVDITIQIAEGLAVAHEAGIVHRDIKPANIMVLHNGVVKITDFGVALIPSASRTMAGVILGSPKYMSPEQVVGQKVDGRSDIFSLGIVLYEMLTGVSPFSADNISAIMYRILNETPASPKSLKPELPEAFDYIVANALAKAVESRYQNARDLIADLRSYDTLSMPDISLPQARSRPSPIIGDDTLPPGDAEVVEPAAAAATAGVAAPLAKEQKPLLWIGAALLAAAVAAFALFRPAPAPTPAPQAAAPARGPASALPGAPPAGVAAPPEAPPATEVPAPPTEKSAAPATEHKPKSKKAPAKPTSRTAPLREEAQAPAVPEPPAKPKPEESAVAEKPAHLFVAVAPWGEIYVDGKRHGVSPPLNKLTLPPGKHRIEIRNGNFPPFDETMELTPDSTKKIKHKF